MLGTMRPFLIMILRGTLLCLSLLIFGSLLAQPVSAETCGRRKIHCECGDTVTENRKLTQDLGTCRDVGLRVRSGVTLDCNGFVIRGRSSREGILLQGVDGARVRNCEVSGFRFGIRVRAGRSSQISSNKLHGNYRGLSIGEEAEDIHAESNFITKNRELGILVNPATENTHIYDNIVTENGRRNIDIRGARGLLLDRNTVGGRTRYDLQFRHVQEARIRSNEFSGGKIQIRGNSDRNQFLDNRLLGRNGFDFRGEEDRDGNWFGPDFNEVSGGAVLGARRCFRFAGATYNVVSDVTLGECAGRPTDLRTVDGHPAIGNEVEGQASQNVTATGVCGGDVVCKCGDLVRGSARLSEDLLGCDRVGLRIESGTTLDCGGHAIVGRQSDSGLRLQEARDVRIRNCRIENFEIGIRAQSVQSLLVTDTQLVLNRTGIRVSGASKDVRIDGNSIEQSREIGVAISGGAEDTQIVQNTFLASRKAHIEIEETDEALVDRNVFDGTVRRALKLVDARRTFVRSNDILEGGIELRGGSTENRFLDNFLADEGFRFEGIEERGGPWRFPDDNLIEGGAIPNARRCFVIRGASRNIFRNVVLGECEERPFELKNADDHKPLDNRIE